MANLNVAYQRGNYGLQTLVAERITKWGKPARYSEYVTGYKSADNFTGHNPDSNGIVHAVDIFVGPGNLTPAQGVELANAVVAEGRKGLIPGHPKRVTYVIHNRQIAGDFSDWLWQPYAGADPHTDHVHVSSYDLYWGDALPASYGPADYDSTLPWGLLSTTKPQTSKPLEEIMATLDAEDIQSIAAAVWGYKNKALENRDAYQVLRDSDAKVSDINTAQGPKSLRTFVAQGTRAAQGAQAENVALRTALQQVSTGQTVDYSKIQEAVSAALKESTVTVDVNVAGAK